MSDIFDSPVRSTPRPPQPYASRRTIVIEFERTRAPGGFDEKSKKDNTLLESGPTGKLYGAGSKLKQNVMMTVKTYRSYESDGPLHPPPPAPAPQAPAPPARPVPMELDSEGEDVIADRGEPMVIASPAAPVRTRQSGPASIDNDMRTASQANTLMPKFVMTITRPLTTNVLQPTVDEAGNTAHHEVIEIPDSPTPPRPCLSRRNFLIPTTDPSDRASATASGSSSSSSSDRRSYSTSTTDAAGGNPGATRIKQRKASKSMGKERAADAEINGGVEPM